MKINDRTEYVGSHVTPDVKKRLEEEAEQRGMSVSRFIYRILCWYQEHKAASVKGNPE